MTERCQNCGGRGRVTFIDRLYDYPPTTAACSTCSGTGIHRRAYATDRGFGLDMRGERLRKLAEREAQRRAEETLIYGPTGETGPFPDEFNVGQDAVAQIHLDLALETISQSVVEAFSTGYENEKWRAMRRRQFDNSLSTYRRAQEVLSASGVTYSEVA